ncbi:MAG TPA: alpha/beta fold hydrolase [Kofleriaceae bacterium]|nr:alpha/beta fold hydrolase [Kofleriaceae bacterium]
MARLLLLVALVAGCATAPAPLPAPDPAPGPERPVQHARANGISLAWDSFGDESAPPLLLIMGLGMQLIGWDEALCETLAARGFRVIRFDNRDAGLSTGFDDAGDPDVLRVADDLRRKRPVRAAYHLSDMAEDAIGLLDALAIPAAHVAGVSMGGMIAQELAIRHPDRVLSLTSIMSNTGDPTVKGASFEVLTALLAPFPPDRAGFIARSVALARTIGSPGFPFDEARVRRLAARAFARAYHPSGIRRQLVAIWTSGSRKPGLAALRVPTLVVHGDADPLIPVEGGRDTAATVPGARLEIIAGMGHDLPPAIWPRLVDAIARMRPPPEQ